MPHRVLEPYPMPHRHFDRRPSSPSAPPIATLSSTNSPATSVSSLDRSSVSTPPIRHSSPHAHTVPSYYASQHQPYYSHPPPPLNHHHHHSHRGYDSHENSPYSMPTVLPPFSHHGMGGGAPSGMGMTMGQIGGREQYGVPGGMPMSMPYPGVPMNSNIPVVFTEDAATKLSDRVRRRCFNCCTTDTSTWRRSNLSPGKVLCNKCGLFERTHSRPRPEQFPHKRGPLATSVLRSRSPPPHTLPSPSLHNQQSGQGSPSMANTLPPISSPYPYAHPPHPILAPLNSAPPSSNGAHHGSRREDDDHKRSASSRSWEDRTSPPISKRSPRSVRASPAPPSLSGSGVSTKSSRSRHDDHYDEA